MGTLTRAERASFIAKTRMIDIPVVDAIFDPRDTDKYEQLARIALANYVELTGGSQAPVAAESGFLAIGSILEQVPGAYVSYWSETKPGEYDSEWLRGVLLSSFENTVVPLSNTSSRVNRTLETWAAIRGDNPIGEGSAYEFIGETVPVLQMKRQNLECALSDISRRIASGDLGLPKPDEKCPALKFILPRAWQGLVETCVSNVALFEDDIRYLSSNPVAVN